MLVHIVDFPSVQGILLVQGAGKDQCQAGIKVLTEDRNSGQVSHGKTSLADPYKISIGTDRYEAFTKNAYIFNKEKNTNLALIQAIVLVVGVIVEAQSGRKALTLGQFRLEQQGGISVVLVHIVDFPSVQGILLVQGAGKDQCQVGVLPGFHLYRGLPLDGCQDELQRRADGETPYQQI